MGSTSSKSNNNSPETMESIKSTVENNSVVIYSKTYCPYCTTTKNMFGKEFPNVKPVLIELDKISGGSAIQAALLEFSGQRTVPNVFVNGTHLGGNDDTQAAFRSGELSKMLSK
mmetsp:Transcript_21664/g.20813  ORF Transcript_21664/g.20813 Transcript_21664/m.20813 type:complete len:114 (-) Transcript_21664:372-713(-)